MALIVRCASAPVGSPERRERLEAGAFELLDPVQAPAATPSWRVASKTSERVCGSRLTARGRSGSVQAAARTSSSGRLGWNQCASDLQWPRYGRWVVALVGDAHQSLFLTEGADHLGGAGEERSDSHRPLLSSQCRGKSRLPAFSRKSKRELEVLYFSVLLGSHVAGNGSR